MTSSVFTFLEGCVRENTIVIQATMSFCLSPAPLYPALWVLNDLHESPFFRVLIRTQVAHVLPPRRLRKTHEDALDTRAGRHETELCAAVVDEVEFNVASATHELPATLVWCTGRILAPGNDGDVLRDKRVSTGLDELD